MCALDEALLARSQLGKQQTARAVQSIQLLQRVLYKWVLETYNQNSDGYVFDSK